MLNNTTLAIIAIVAVIGLVVAESINIPQQQALAKGCPLTTAAANASK
jgi:hypothetical protein